MTRVLAYLQTPSSEEGGIRAALERAGAALELAVGSGPTDGPRPDVVLVQAGRRTPEVAAWIDGHHLPWVLLLRPGEPADPDDLARAHGVLFEPLDPAHLAAMFDRARLCHGREQALRRSENRLRATLRSIADGVMTTDELTRITWMNPAAERMTGWTCDEARGVRLGDVISLQDGKTGRRLPNPLTTALATRSAIGNPPGAVLVSRSGAHLSVSDHAAPIVDASGEVNGGVLVLQDTSEREAMNAHLARADRLASMGMMSAGIAHEVNNPLTYLIANLDFVIRQLAAAQSDRTQLAGVLAEAVEGARTIERIIGDLRQLSTVEERPVALTEVAATVRRAARVAEPTVRVVGTLTLDVAATAPVYADPNLLAQVIVDLLLNAAEAFPPEWDAAHIVTLATAMAGDRVCIEVSDTGSGIAADHLDRIFDPFFTTKPVGRGTGLGLAVAYRTVAGFGGRIDVDSEVGRGSTFRILLPAGSATVYDSIPPRLASPRVRARECRILVIDDDPLLRRAVARMLGTTHQLEVVDAAEAALVRIRAGASYDLILCDVMMAPISGAEFHQILKRTHPGQAERLAFITADVKLADERAYVEAAGQPILFKPFSARDVDALLSDPADDMPTLP